MKKLARLWKALYNTGGLHNLAYFLTIGWYAYALKIIENTELPLIIKGIMFLGGIFFGIFSCKNLFK